MRSVQISSNHFKIRDGYGSGAELLAHKKREMPCVGGRGVICQKRVLVMPIVPTCRRHTHCGSLSLLVFTFGVQVLGTSPSVAGFAGGDKVVKIVSATGIMFNEVVGLCCRSASAPMAQLFTLEDYEPVLAPLASCCALWHCQIVSVMKCSLLFPLVSGAVTCRAD